MCWLPESMDIVFLLYLLWSVIIYVVIWVSFDGTSANGSHGHRLLTSDSFVISRTKTPRHEDIWALSSARILTPTPKLLNTNTLSPSA